RRVDVLVIIAAWQLAELPAEALAAGVGLTRRAPAVPPPVAYRAHGLRELGIVDEDRAPLAHRDVVGGEEAQGREVAKRAQGLPAPRPAERVAAVLDEIEAVALRQVHDDVEVARVAEGVREQQGARLRAEGGLEEPRVHVVRAHLAIHED